MKKNEPNSGRKSAKARDAVNGPQVCAGYHGTEYKAPPLTFEVGDGETSVDSTVRRYQSGLLRYSQQWGGPFASSCEVVQETFLRLLEEARNGGKFQSDSHLRAWLYRVCRQRAIDQHRKGRRMKTSLETESLPDCDQEDPAEVVSSRETSQQVQTELDRLSTNQQEVVRLKFQVGMSYREIAEVTGLTVTNVGYLLHTAITSLKSKLT